MRGRDFFNTTYLETKKKNIANSFTLILTNSPSNGWPMKSSPTQLEVHTVVTLACFLIDQYLSCTLQLSQLANFCCGSKYSEYECNAEAFISIWLDQRQRYDIFRCGWPKSCMKTL